MTFPSRNAQPARQAASRVPEDAPRRRTPAGDGPLFEQPAQPAEPATKERPAGWRPPIEISISAVLNGWPIEVTYTGQLAQLPAAIERLREIGAVPAVLASAAAMEAEQQREAPVCPYHGPMKPSTKRPGTWYCPSNMGDSSYCCEKFPKE